MGRGKNEAGRGEKKAALPLRRGWNGANRREERIGSHPPLHPRAAAEPGTCGATGETAAAGTAAASAPRGDAARPPPVGPSTPPLPSLLVIRGCALGSALRPRGGNSSLRSRVIKSLSISIYLNTPPNHRTLAQINK